MKKLVIIALLGLGVGQVNAQTIKASDVPAAVKTAFAKAYPAAKDVKWGKEDGSFEASFDHNKKDMSVLLDVMGMIKEVETEIEKSELPKAVQETLKKDFADHKVEEAAKIVSNGVTTYEAEVEKGEKSWDLIFDANGKLLKKEPKSEKD
ncbi:hypothetical protein BH10BAC4_BH10BAC4_14060 [soil metagenome]